MTAFQRLGILTPSSNTVLEPATIRLVEPLRDRLSVHFARFRVTRIADDPASDAQFDPAPMLEAASLLADARVDAVLWSGTSAAWRGIDADERLVQALEAAVGAPATTSTLALLAAFEAIPVRRYGLVVPYVDPIVAAIRSRFAERGYECIASDQAGLETNWEFGAISGEAIAAQVRRVAAAGPDAIAIHCTNLRGAEVAGTLESELGIPVIDSVVVGLWSALGTLRIDVPTAGFGSLARLPSRTATTADA